MAAGCPRASTCARRAAWACSSSPPWSRKWRDRSPRPPAGRDPERGPWSTFRSRAAAAKARWTTPPGSLTSPRNRYSLWELVRLNAEESGCPYAAPYLPCLPPVWPLPSLLDRPSPWPVPARPRGPAIAGRGEKAAAAPTGGGSNGSKGLEAKHSLRAPVTDENFYFVMADRFANGDTANDTGGIPGGPNQHGFDPTNKGFYQGGDLKGLLEKIDYIEDLVRPPSGSPRFQEQGRPTRGRAVGRLPRLLDHRLHPDRPAPRHQCRASPRSSTPPMRGG